uniref:Uncharacterized protein n=1 Tax=Arundo donax TaxID=35708 RepID=A0A0A9BVU7_ARUDO
MCCQRQGRINQDSSLRRLVFGASASTLITSGPFCSKVHG